MLDQLAVAVGQSAARAILSDDIGRLVLIKRTKPGQAPYWTAPGGGIEDAGTSVETVVCADTGPGCDQFLGREGSVGQQAGEAVADGSLVVRFVRQDRVVGLIVDHVVCRGGARNSAWVEVSDSAGGLWRARWIRCQVDACETRASVNVAGGTKLGV